MAALLNAEDSLISLHKTDDKAVKNDQSCEINDGSNKKSKKEEEQNVGMIYNGVVANGNGGGGKEEYVYRTRAEERKMLLDLSEFPQLAAMFAAEATMKKNRKSKKKKKKRQQQQMSGSADPNAMVEEAGKRSNGLDTKSAMLPRIDNDESQRHQANDAEEEKEVVICNIVKTTKPVKVGDDVTFDVMTDMRSSYLEGEEVIVDPRSSRGLVEMEPTDATVKEEMRIDIHHDATCAVEEDKQVDSNKDAETRMLSEMELAEKKDNIVLQSLLRAPRYFDFPECSWDMCYNCGEDDHTTTNCTMQKRNRPCYVCGDFRHKARRCNQRYKHSMRKGEGCIAKDCPEKDAAADQSFKICLRCRDSGHDMLSCSYEYNSDDLREIQCYVCKEFGHLCCADFIDECPIRVSCYNCGQSGHLGSNCAEPDSLQVQKDWPFSPRTQNIYRGREETSDLATPGKLSEEKKDTTRFNSAPHKSHRTPRRTKMTGGQSERMCGVNTVRSQNLFRFKPGSNVWLSPAAAAATKKSLEISASTARGQYFSH